MSLLENAAAGAGLASLELHRVMITLLIRHGVLPADLTMAMIDISLQNAENADAALRAVGKFDEADQWRAARFHIAATLTQCRLLRDQIASQGAPGSSPPEAGA